MTSLERRVVAHMTRCLLRASRWTGRFLHGLGIDARLD